MPINRPYRRTCRQLADGSYANDGNSRYVRHSAFAVDGRQYIRAFMLLQKDILELFNYVEPGDKNLCCYSFRIHELHMRVCIEVEANCKAILTENNYVKAGGGDLDMNDYRKLNATHHLSSYEVRMPYWHGNQHTRTPFAAWAGVGGLDWYQAYNAAKHDRHNEFARSNFANLLQAMSGLVAVVSAQFHTYDFLPDVQVGEAGPDGGFDITTGGYFHVKFPTDWPMADRYVFSWRIHEKEPNPFQVLTFA